MNVIEIFDSIDGEGKFAGCLATFIRLSGCNLRCSYCDTEYAFTGGKEMSVDEIVLEVKKIGNNHITLTGGEPLIHKDVEELIFALCKEHFLVNIETNGSVDIKKYQNQHTIITMDCKMPSSGENNKMKYEYIKKLRKQDILKLVCNESDFPYIKKILKECKVESEIYISPIFNEIQLNKLVNFMKELRNNEICKIARLQLQLHKIIWKPGVRGV